MIREASMRVLLVLGVFSASVMAVGEVRGQPDPSEPPPSDDVAPSDDTAPSDDAPPSDDTAPSDDAPPSDDTAPSDDAPPSDDVAPSDEPAAPAPPPDEPTSRSESGPPVAAFPDESPPPSPQPSSPQPSSPQPPPRNTTPSTPATAPPAPPPTQPTTPPPPAAPGDGFEPGYDATRGGPSDYDFDRDDGKDQRAVRLGPIVGVGLPNLLSFGGQLKVTRFFGAGVNVGLIPSVKINYYGEATLKYQEYDIYGRVYPFGNALFIGVGVGYETVTGVFVEEVDLTAYNRINPSIPASLQLRSEGRVQTMIVTPQIGLLKTFKSGFSVGIDAGAQIPIAPSDVEFKTKVSDVVPQQVVDQYVEPNDETVRVTLEKIGQTPLPTFNVRIGWLF